MERIANDGYLALIKQSDKNVPLTPTFFLPLYEESLTTNRNFVKQQPIYGGKHITFDVLPGQRDHQGEFTTMAEGNGTGYFMDMLYTRISSNTSSGKTTHVFRPSTTQNPNAYTVDLSTGNVVKRFWGVEASAISPVWNDNEMQHKITVSARGSFQGRSIASVSTTTLTLDTTYDPSPTTGLVAGDLVRIFKASTGATLDTAVDSVTNGTTVVLDDSAAAFAAGDIIHLRPATQTFNLLPTFLWARTEFRYADNAAAALSAAQTRLEVGSTFELIHSFEDEAGAKRSGGFDPAALVRLTSDANHSAKKYFDTPEEVQRYNDILKRAVAIRHFAGPANEYEYRVQLHNITTDTPVANLKAQEVNYSTINYITEQDQTDGHAVTVTVINTIASI